MEVEKALDILEKRFIENAEEQLNLYEPGISGFEIEASYLEPGGHPENYISPGNVGLADFETNGLTLSNISDREDASGQYNSDDSHPYSVKLERGKNPSDPSIMNDIGPHIELISNAQQDLRKLHDERLELESIAVDNLPPGIVLSQTGAVFGLMDRNNSGKSKEADPFTWDVYDEGESKRMTEYFTEHTFNQELVEIYGDSIGMMGGINAIHVTGQPFMDERNNGVLAYFGDANHTSTNSSSMLKLQPVIAAPFHFSPLMENGEVKKWYLGDDLYEIAYGGTEQRNQKIGLVEDVLEAESVRSYIEIIGSLEPEISGGIPAGEIQHADSNSSLADITDLDAGTRKRIMIENYETFWDIVESEEFSGKVLIDNKNPRLEPVQFAFDSMEEEYLTGHYNLHSYLVFSSVRIKPFLGIGVEFRDIDSTPWNQQAIDTVSALNLEWERFQKYCDETLELREVPADEFRKDVARDRLSYVTPSGHTLREGWLGETDSETSILEIMGEGVEKQSSSLYRSYFEKEMEELLRSNPAKELADKVKEGNWSEAVDTTAMNPQNEIEKIANTTDLDWI